MVFQNSFSLRNIFLLFIIVLVFLNFYFLLINKIYVIYLFFFVSSLYLLGFLMSWLLHTKKSKFDCVNCGWCCKLKVKLKKSDVKRLTKVKDWENFVDEDLYLKRVNDCCIFLKDRGNKKICSIYKYRPTVCMKWPFFCQSKFSISWLWFFSCPSLRKLIAK
jgi:hypothetical protein